MTLAVVLVWTLVSVIGVSVSIWATVDSIIDRQAQRQSGMNSALSAIVTINLRSAQASLLLHSFFLFLGIRALLVPPASSPGFLFVACGYIAVAATNVRAVGLNQRDRVRLRQRERR